jgi:plastocyanin
VKATRTRLMAAMAAGGTAAALVLAPVTTAQAAATALTINVGSGGAVHGFVLEGMRFGAPDSISVHRGDTLTFNFEGFHTATLIPKGIGADDWRMDHTGPGGDYSLIKSDADDPQPAFELNKAVLFPSAQNCGTATAPCNYNGATVVNSGVPLGAPTFSVTVDATPGSTFWVLCIVHSMMQMRVNVVPDGTAATTQAQITASESATNAQQREEAAAIINRLQKPTHHKTASGHVVWDAYSGYDGAGWGLDGMFPTTLRIHKGDTVRWHFAQLLGNVHTVTFPRSTAIDLANKDFAGQNVVCESPTGDTPADAPPPAFCSSGPQNAEFAIRSIGILPQGSHKFFGKKTGLRSSGVRGPDGLTTLPYDLKFKKVSPKKGFRYACAVHGAMMSGRVIVTH